LRISIFLQLFILITLSVIFSISVIGAISIISAQQLIEKETTEKLESIAELKIQQINQFFNSINADISTTQTLRILETNLPTIANLINDQSDPNYFKTKELLDTYLSPFQDEKKRIQNVMLIDLNGDIVYMTNNDAIANLKTPLKDPHGKSFTIGQEKIYFSDIFEDRNEQGVFRMITSAPIHSINGQLIGIIAFEINVDRLYTLLEKRDGLGDTGETILGRNTGDEIIFLSPLRHNNFMPLELKIPTEQNLSMSRALTEKTGSGYVIDYRDEKVFAKWKNIPLVNWGFVSKVDSAEIDVPIINLQNSILFYSVILISVMGLSGIIVSRKMTNPIILIDKEFTKIEQGNFNVSLTPQGSRELHHMALSFNKMAAFLQKYAQTNLEKMNLQTALEKQKEIDVKKQEFSSMVSHELKTPLSPILGHCEMLEDADDSKNLTPDQLYSIKIIHKSADRMLMLVSDLLDVQKLNLNQLKFNHEDILVADFLTNTYDDFPDLVNDKKIEFINSTSSNSTIFADAIRLQQIMNNLIKNSNEFISKENGVIEFGARDKENDVLFYVKDNGTGISAENIPHLFKKFYQVDTSDQKSHGGTGLGLAICYGLVKGMGGEIWVESEVGKCTSFYFTIPKKTS